MTTSESIEEPAESANPPPHSGISTGEQPSTGAFFERRDWLSLGLTTAALFLVYLITMAPDVTLENSGYQATSALYGGVVSPPGHTVWTVYSWLCTKLPFSNIARRVATGSALAAALTGGLVALLVSRGGKMLLEKARSPSHLDAKDQSRLRILSGYVAGMAFGLSQTIWRKAVIVDFFAFNNLLFALMVCLLLRWHVTPERNRFLYGACVVLGLILTGSQELVVVIPGLLMTVMLRNRELGRDMFFIVIILSLVAGHFGVFPFLLGFEYCNMFACVAIGPVAAIALIVIFLTRRLGTEWFIAILCTICFLLGFAWCLYLPPASMTNPPVNWGYPRTVEGFFHVMTRGQYERASPTNDLASLFHQFWAIGKDFGQKFGWIYFPLALLPFCSIHFLERTVRNWMLALLAMLMCVGPILIDLLNPSIDRLGMELHNPYFSGVPLVLAVWTGFGLVILADKLAGNFRGRPCINA